MATTVQEQIADDNAYKECPEKIFVQLPFTATIWEEIIDTASSNVYPCICSYFSTIATVGVKNLEHDCKYAVITNCDYW